MRTIPILLAGVAIFAIDGSLCRVLAQGDDQCSIKMRIFNPDNQTVTVTLYRNGKAFSTREVTFEKDNRDVDVAFERLPYGDYEVRFEASEHTTVIKKVILKINEQNQSLTTKLMKGKGSEVIGGGASIEELETRIKKLEEAVAALQKK
jgi:hypothetical protein